MASVENFVVWIICSDLKGNTAHHDDRMADTTSETVNVNSLCGTISAALVSRASGVLAFPPLISSYLN